MSLNHVNFFIFIQSIIKSLKKNFEILKERHNKNYMNELFCKKEKIANDKNSEITKLFSFALNIDFIKGTLLIVKFSISFFFCKRKLWRK